MTGQHDRQDEKLTGQLANQSGHCPLTGRYFEPCIIIIILIVIVIQGNVILIRQPKSWCGPAESNAYP